MGGGGGGSLGGGGGGGVGVGKGLNNDLERKNLNFESDKQCFIKRCGSKQGAGGGVLFDDDPGYQSGVGILCCKFLGDIVDNAIGE